jgi:urea transporter
MVMATVAVQMAKHMQTMYRQAATVVLLEVVASVIVIVIAIAIASRWELETAAVE